ncbi:MAG: hypothetical protein LQ352_001534 [Teloschistes flavicans]|nr:MAG: hypothetical protein LQ352_001534 [Teloschistes flavicans]
MPPGVYRAVREQCLGQVAGFFHKAASPIEAPEKTTFGDIDLIVSEAKTTPFPVDSIARALNAERTIHSNPISCFAVPYPEREGNYVQVDVYVCDPKYFDWEIFHQSHGDLWNLLGSSIRPFGLTANNTGLHVRIAEIESLDRKKSLISLTADPHAVLDFLHLDRAVLSRSFDTVESMFEFACSNRFFRPDAYIRHDLKANDRKRLAQRDLYRRFVDDYVLCRTARAQQIDDVEQLTRREVLDEALERFQKRPEYGARLQAWREEREELAHKQASRDWRKRKVAADEAYADAWIKTLAPSTRIDGLG